MVNKDDAAPEAAKMPDEEREPTAAEAKAAAALEAARALPPTPEEDIPPIEKTKFKSGSAYQGWAHAGARPGTEKDFE